MATSTDVIKQVYAAFGRGDVDGILAHVAGEVDFEFVASKALPYAGNRRNHQQVADFFAAVAKADDIHAFEPREFIEAGDHVTVLGWEKATARDTHVPFESEWIHVFTVKHGKIIRWRGSYNTAARYGK